MALTTHDETDLLLPLFIGASESSPLSSFLETLRRRAGVIFASIIIRAGVRHEGVVLFAGPALHRGTGELQFEGSNPVDRIHYDRLRLGRVYAGDEFIDHDPLGKAGRAPKMRKLGIVDERIVRLLDDEAVSAWLSLASARSCTASHSALLSNLVPYAAAAVRAFVSRERQMLATALDGEGLRRTGLGWIVFDKAARILALAPETSQTLGKALGHPPRVGERLREFGPVVERALSEAAAAFAQDCRAEERSLVLSQVPAIQAILAPYSGAKPAIEAPALIAYCRHARPAATDRAKHLARLFNLPRREAELALLIAVGLSLTEAAEAMGLTIETTRNYSKRLFAALGVRGQAELVRVVYESCAVLAS